MTTLDGGFNTAKKAMTALGGGFSTPGLGPEWYIKACTVGIPYFTIYEKSNKPPQKRARMRSSSTECTPTYRKESTRLAFPRAKNLSQDKERRTSYQLVDGQVHYVGHIKGCEGDLTKRVNYFNWVWTNPL